MPYANSSINADLLTTYKQIANNDGEVPSASFDDQSIHNRDLIVAYRRTTQLKPYARNARTHSKSQIRKIAESIREFGWTNPVLLDQSDMIVAGHGRVEAAKLLGIEEVPTIRLESLTPAQIQAYVIADNRLAEDAGWDKQILKIELQNLILSTDIDISLTGFEVAEIDQILRIGDETPEEDDLPAVTGSAVSQVGDLWMLGKHRIICGDARNDSDFAKLMEAQRATVVFIDPPYNVRVDGHVCGNGKARHNEFAMASGEMDEAQFTSFLTTVFGRLANWSVNGSVHFVAMDHRHIGELVTAGNRVYDSRLNVCVWVKDKGGMGSFYRSQHELIFVFRKGGEQHRNNVQLGKFGRNRTNVWQYPGANTLSRIGEEGNLLAMHPTVKPTALVADALLDCSARGEIVLDSFLGSGSTLLAAERVGRVCYGLEIEPQYVDLAIRRWQNLTGEDAMHSATGLKFNEVAKAEVANV